MQNIDIRIKSFEAITKPKTKAKIGFPLNPKTHANLNADTLSKAGFYHTPGSTEESYDNCKCFLCNVELGGWDENDDPFEEHSRRGNCAWAEMVCTVKLEKRKRDQSDGKYITTYTTQESLPQSKESAAVREQTYKKWWPHKQKSGWLPTVKNLAQAGFVYTPSTESKDAVMCPYCEYAVEGWEATDDPWQTHYKKVPDCHFFRAELAGGESSTQKVAKAPAKTKKSEVVKRPKRGTTAAPSIVSETEEEPSQATELPSEAEEPISLSQPTTTKKKATKPRATTSRRKTVTRGKKKDATVEPKEEPEIVEIADDTITSISQSQLPPTSTEEVQPLEKIEEKKGKSKKATKPRPKPSSAANTKSKAKKKVEEEEEAETEEDQITVESEIEVETENEDQKETDNEPELEIDSIPLPRLRHSSKPASIFIPSASSQQSKSSKPSKTSSNSKPLPPLPLPSPITSPPPRPLSQLDRFSNIPPSSPIPTTSSMLSSPKPKALLRSNQPNAKSSPHSKLPRDVLESSLIRGAVEAKKVMDDLMSSPITNTPRSNSNAKQKKNENDMTAEDEEEEEGMMKLTEEQKSMTLEDLVKMEMQKRYEAMQKEGEDLIAKWEERARSERKRIEAI